MIERVGDGYKVTGPVTLANVLEVLAAGERAFDGTTVRVDFSGVTDIDSSALSLLLEWKRRLRGSGARIVYSNLGTGVSSLIDLYGVRELVNEPAG